MTITIISLVLLKKKHPKKKNVNVIWNWGQTFWHLLLSGSKTCWKYCKYFVYQWIKVVLL